jgi:hypothetical protein
MADITKAEKLKFEAILKPEFMAAISELGSIDLPARNSYWVGKAITKLDAHLKAYEITRTKTLKKFTELDEAGEIKTDEKTKGVIFKTPEDEKTFKKELEELRNEEIEVLKIDVKALVPEKGNEAKDAQKIKPWIFSALDCLLY